MLYNMVNIEITFPYKYQHHILDFDITQFLVLLKLPIQNHSTTGQLYGIQRSDYRKADKTVFLPYCQSNHSLFSLSLKSLFSTVKEILENPKNVMVIIDGLDECADKFGNFFKKN